MRILPLSLLILSASVSFAQTTNQAAVDTLTKEVAMAVFAPINQPKAQEIYDQLLSCGDGCEAQQIIRAVGSWDQVGERIQQLSLLRDTKSFIGLSPGAANEAIRRQLALFYQQNKAYESYRKALTPAVQQRILAKIDLLLPPTETTPAPTTAQAANSPDATTAPAVTGDEASVDPATFQMSQLERQVKEAQEKQRWMMIISGLIGLLAGAGAIYLLLYRGAQAEVKALQNTNNRLMNELEQAKRTKPANDTSPVRGDQRQKVSGYDAIVAELGSDNPLTTIRQLKRQAAENAPKPAPPIRSGEFKIESAATPEPVAVVPPVPVVPAPEPVPMPTPAPALNKPEVFYLPPPDPTGQFDLSQKAGTLSPASAYRFSVTAENPTAASFRFEADPSRLARFLTYRNYMIEPACDSENSYTTTHTRVAMRKDGEAVLENGAWRVKTKALIRYE